MKSYFYIVHAKKQTESQKYGKLYNFWEKIVIVYIDMVV